MIFDKARRRHGIRREIGPGAAQARGSLQSVGNVGGAGVADEESIAPVSSNREGKFATEDRAAVDKWPV